MEADDVQAMPEPLAGSGGFATGPWAAVGAGANLVPGAAVGALLVESLWPGAVAGGGNGVWVTLFWFVASLGSPVVPCVATLGAARQGFDLRQAGRIRRCGWIRPAGVLLGFVVFLVGITWADDDLPWIFLIVAAIVFPGLGADLMLRRTVAELARESSRRNAGRGLSKGASVAIVAVQVMGGLLTFVPFAGWVVGPLVWSVGNAALFGRLARIADRAVRDG